MPGNPDVYVPLFIFKDVDRRPPARGFFFTTSTNPDMAPRMKRKVLTSDDLLCKQDEPHKKRVKHSPPLSIQSGSDGPSSSAGEVNRSTAGDRLDESEEQEQGEDSSEESRKEILDNGTSDDGEDSTSGSQFNSADSSNEPERFKFSRAKDKQTIPQRKLPDSFSAFGISSQLQSALATMSIRTPTEVQAACIPPLLAGK